jgi:hypothetical protein
LREKTVSRVNLILAILAGLSLSSPVAFAQAQVQKSQAQGQAQSQTVPQPEKKLTRGERRRQRILEQYEATGNVENCVPMRSLRQSIILDDQTIFFESTGRRGYINKLPAKCNGLMREERFAYGNSFGSLCRAEIITVLDSFGRSWGSCGLGDFEEYSKKPKSDSDN